ncbi:MAG: hypothetical protein ACKPKO_50750 [Candidatus Fonsibacter sp.]
MRIILLYIYIYRMTTLAKMMFKSNIIERRSHLKRFPESNKAKINEVIKIYEDRNIPNIKNCIEYCNAISIY